MTTYNKADLRNRVLRDMGVLDAVESASASDAEIVDAIVQQSIEELEDEDVIIFNPLASETTDNIPGRIFSALADYVRFHAMPTYGLAKDDGLRESAFRRLRRATGPASDDVPVPAKFY